MINHAEIFYSENFMFGQRVNYIIEKQGLSKAWVAERLGISKQALNYLLKHSVKPKFIDEFSELFGLSSDWLEKGIGLPYQSTYPSNYVLKNVIPVLTKSELLDASSVSVNGVTIDFSRGDFEYFIAYKLDDDSNFPPFIEGSILIFDTREQPISSDYVLIVVNGEVMVRQYLIDGKNRCYKAIGAVHKTFINPVSVKLVGVLFEARYQLDRMSTG